MFKRKLAALVHTNPNNFNASDDSDFHNIIIWLEDQKIRHYKIEDREQLRAVEKTQWLKAIQKYLQDLGCPYNQDDRLAATDWLLGYAIRLEYGDNVEKYNNVSSDAASQTKQSTGEPLTNPLDNLDFDSAEFKAGVASLATLLKIPPHHNHHEVCKAVCKLITERLSKETLEKPSKQTTSQANTTPLAEIDLGFDTGDYISNDAAKILRLLHIKNLRDVQTKVNEAIVAVQSITANPKTDQRLGKVGR